MELRRERLAYLRRERVRVHASYLASIARATATVATPSELARASSDRMRLGLIDQEIEGLWPPDGPSVERRNNGWRKPA